MRAFDTSGRPRGWVIDLGRRDYAPVWRWQKSLVPLRRRGIIRDTLIMVEHSPVYTLGRQTDPANVARLSPDTPRFEVERGGDVTYHGPGQLVCYPIFDLQRRGRDLHLFMRNLERGIINTLASYEVNARAEAGNTGVWVTTPAGGRKIASIGVAAQKWVSYHGVAVNVNTDLEEFAQINPCGFDAAVMTSLAALTGRSVTLTEFRDRLIAAYGSVFEMDFDFVTTAVIAEDLKSEEAGGHV